MQVAEGFFVIGHKELGGNDDTSKHRGFEGDRSPWPLNPTRFSP